MIPTKKLLNNFYLLIILSFFIFENSLYYLFKTNASLLISNYIIYITGTIFFYIFFLSKSLDLKKVKEDLFSNFKAKYFLLSIFLLTVIYHRFFLLSSYPFTFNTDAIRDGGLLVQSLFKSNKVDLFQNGPYFGFSKTIVGFLSPFYYIFKDTNLTYRVPAALISIFTIIISYILFYNKKKSTILALIISCILFGSPQLIEFSRSAVLLTLDILFPLLIIFHLMAYLKNKSDFSLFSLLVILGFSFNFHVSLWPIILITLLIVFVSFFSETFDLKKFAKLSLASLVIFLFAIGPRIQNINEDVLFQRVHTQNKFPLFRLLTTDNEYESKEITESLEVQSVLSKYVDTFFLYFKNDARGLGHLHYERPYLTPIIGALFILGLLLALIYWKGINRALLLFPILIPLTNGALTDFHLYSHRTSVMLPISLFFIHYALTFIFDFFKKRQNKVLNIILTLFILLVVFESTYRAFDYFLNDRGHENVTSNEFMGVYLSKTLTNLSSENSHYCIESNSEIYKHLNLFHNKYYLLKYFTPDISLHYLQNNDLPKNSIYIKKQCSLGINGLNFNVHHFCETYEPLKCPINIQDGPLSIYYEF